VIASDQPRKTTILTTKKVKKRSSAIFSSEGKQDRSRSSLINYSEPQRKRPPSNIPLFPRRDGWELLGRPLGPRGWREWLRRLAIDTLQVSSTGQWYRISTKDLRAHHGECLLETYGGTLEKVLSTMFPEGPRWLPWCFLRESERHLWIASETGKHRELIEWLAKQLGLHDIEDWHAASLCVLRYETTHGQDPIGSPSWLLSTSWKMLGILLRVRYGGSLQRLLCEVKRGSDFAWCAALEPASFWASANNRRAYLTWLAEDVLGLPSCDSDKWHQVTCDMIKTFPGAWRLLSYYDGSLGRALCELYPAQISNVPPIGSRVIRFH